LLGADPDATLIQLAADAAGNPFMLAEAFLGLLDEDAITVAGERASLASAHVPQRMHVLAASRLEGLSAGSRQFTETAPVLGRSFRLEDVAEIVN
jgi:hypothetical protein